jgi:peptidoglycan/LPS O-acetylase OafA/YrhL
MLATHKFRDAVARINAATPPERDRAMDALRAFAILGVVLGHWMVTAIVATDDGELRVASPLKHMPAFTPISWVLQTLAVFFLVGGYTAAKGYKPGSSWSAWMKRRFARLMLPVPILLLAWVPAVAVLLWAGYSPATVRSLVKLVLSPLWFLIVYGTLTALAPLIVAAYRRTGALAGTVILVSLTAVIDALRFGPDDGPRWLGWATVLTGWLVPFLLGIAWADGALASRRIAAPLLAGGAAATAALILFAGYPASMVGVPGAEVSNLNPPTLAAVTFGLAQVGLALLVRDHLARWMRHPRTWTVVALANMAAMTVFLWHQTALMAVTVSVHMVTETVPGLLTVPDHPGWALDRLSWLPAFAVALAAIRAIGTASRTTRTPRLSPGPSQRLH